MPKYSQLRVDGVLGDIYDSDAVHTDEVVNVVLNVLDSPVIRTALLNIYHPIGSYYFTDRNINPSTFLGGTWETVEGRFLIGASSSYPVNSEGGSADLILPAHTHSVEGTITAAGAHSHTGSGTAAYAGDHAHLAGSKRYNTYKGDGSYDALMDLGYNANYTATSTAGGHTHGVSISTTSNGSHTHAFNLSTDSVGEEPTNKNLPPYKSAYIWVRTA